MIAGFAVNYTQQKFPGRDEKEKYFAELIINSIVPKYGIHAFEGLKRESVVKTDRVSMTLEGAKELKEYIQMIIDDLTLLSEDDEN